MDQQNIPNLFIAILANKITNSLSKNELNDLIQSLRLLLTNIDYCSYCISSSQVTNKDKKT